MLKLLLVVVNDLVFCRRRKERRSASLPAQPKGLTWHSTFKSVLLFICLLLCVVLPACAYKTTRCPTDGTNNDCQSAGPEILNTHIEVVSQSSLHQSDSIWLRAGDQLVVKWDSYTFFHTFGGANCDFPNLTQKTDDCAICNWCDTSPTFEQLCPFQLRAVGGSERLRLNKYDGFMSNNEQPTTIEFLGDTSGCSARGFAPFSFTPEGNSTYQVLTPEASSSQAVLTNKKVFVIQNGMSQPATYKMDQHTDIQSPLVFYKWTVGGDPIREDNFSTNLRVGKVRVLKGHAVSDPVSGRFMLEGATVIHPSRIVLIPNFNSSLSVFNQDANRCYANSNEDGDFDLTRCRPAFGNNNSFLVDVTPTYMKTQPMDKLWWVVEFNPTEGGTPPVLATGEVLAIEFTIQGV
jgi:hypothetical protein